jgi:hypothetical protein
MATSEARSRSHRAQGEETVTITAEHARDCDGNPCESWCPLAPCPAWCNGQHHRPSWVTEAEHPRYWHKSASCPAWCEGHSNQERDDDLGTHRGLDIEVALSLPSRLSTVSVGDIPQTGCLSVAPWVDSPSAGPSVSVRHHDNYLPDMTPDEAMALARALVRTAHLARASTASNPACADGVPWCAACVPASPGSVGWGAHCSETYSVPVREHEGCCGHERCREILRSYGQPDPPCDDGVDAELYLPEDYAVPIVAVHHGDDTLPEMDLDAAETLGWHLIALAETGRGAAR